MKGLKKHNFLIMGGGLLILLLIVYTVMRKIEGFQRTLPPVPPACYRPCIEKCFDVRNYTSRLTSDMIETCKTNCLNCKTNLEIKKGEKCTPDTQLCEHGYTCTNIKGTPINKCL